jgi:diguanylate cyclase (GGDEF)-like protein
MIAPPVPADEVRRLATLRSLDLLDTAPEERFDRITRLAQRLFDVPAALVSLIDEDRQWFKSSVGISTVQTAREVSFCGHTIASDDILLIPDTSLDKRFHDNPFVTGEPHVRFYVGCPLRVANGSRIGTLCLLDWNPREFSAEDRAILQDLAHMAEQELGAVQLAHVDELTQVPNRRGFQALAQHTLNECCRLELPVSMLFFDLDGFKAINDRFGHAEGDRALVAFTGALLDTFREPDVVGRLGGDEFAVLLSNRTEAEVSLALTHLEYALAIHNRTAAIGYTVRYSTGRVTADTSRHCAVEALLAEADALMYEHKRSRV